MRKFVAFICVGWLILASFSLFSEEGQDPLRNTELKKHLNGPEIEAASLKGKVVFFEYWGYG